MGAKKKFAWRSPSEARERTQEVRSSGNFSYDDEIQVPALVRSFALNGCSRRRLRRRTRLLYTYSKYFLELLTVWGALWVLCRFPLMNRSSVHVVAGAIWRLNTLNGMLERGLQTDSTHVVAEFFVPSLRSKMHRPACLALLCG